MSFTFSENEKFSLLALNHCYSYVKEEVLHPRAPHDER